MHLGRAAAIGIIVGLLATMSGTGSASAAPASPSSISVDCDLTNGVTPTTITGNVGDTVSIINTGSTDVCTFASYAGVVTATNLTSDALATGATSIVTIVAAGTFTITPGVSGGVSGAISVAIGTPVPAPEYTITFDANGGDCSSNPLVISVASQDWYALPTEGTGAYQCHRTDYTLIGWSHGASSIPAGGSRITTLANSANQAPDLPIANAGETPAQAAAADHVTLYAQWSPVGVEITYDANVADADACVDASGSNVPPANRSTEADVFFSGPLDALAQESPCHPLGPDSQPLMLRGWATAGDAAPLFRLGEPMADTGLKAGTSLTLYAVWAAPTPGQTLVVDYNFQVSIEVTGDVFRLTFEQRAATPGWMGLSFGRFMFPADTIVVWLQDGAPNAWDAYNPGIPTLEMFPAPAPDTYPVFVMPSGGPYDNRDNVTVVSGASVDGITTIVVERDLVTEDIFDMQITGNPQQPVCAAYSTLNWNAEVGVQPMHTAYACTLWQFSS